MKACPSVDVGLQLRKNIFVDYETVVGHIRQNRSSAVGHTPQAFHSATAFFAKFRPFAVFTARRKALDCSSVVEFFRRAVNPAETHRFFNRVNIPKNVASDARLTTSQHSVSVEWLFSSHNLNSSRFFALSRLEYVIYSYNSLD